VNRSFSRYLDALRAAAALTVFVSHFAYARFSGGAYQWIRTLNVGSDAVIVFFVLSGFIIDFTADEKDTAVGQFVFSRATRVYSVAIPGLFLTLICDQIGSRFFPAAYSGWWYEGTRLPLRIVTALTFTNELWFEHLRPGTNGPYWSLTYEVWYYAIFAALRYGVAPWRAAIAGALALIAGPKILLLAPSFALGVWVRRTTREREHPGRARALLYAAAAPCLYPALLLLGMPGELRSVTEAVVGADFVRTALGFSDEFLWNGVIGGLFALHLIGVHALLSERRAEARSDLGERAGALARYLAGGSFSLYLVHYPALQLAACLLPGDARSPARQAFLIAGVLAFCLGFAALFERRLPELRTFLRRRVLGVPQV
jgi:peptidoglycan/LPS O-acetylase OafA/YrhL